jgi:hypothetical protein
MTNTADLCHSVELAGLLVPRVASVDKSFLDIGTDRRDCDTRIGDGIGHSVEMMDHPCVTHVSHFDSRAFQPIRIGAAFAKERVEFGGVHMRRRLARDVGSV